MREFIYYSQKARTSGNWTDLMKAGRMDIVCNVIIAGLYLSHKLREDVHLHLIFDGMPNPPMHLEFVSNKELPISKKDVGKLIKIMLYKCNKERKLEIFPGCFIEKKSLSKLVSELEQVGKKIFVLDSNGSNIRGLKNEVLRNSVFIIGDHEGFSKKELKKFKNKISIGKDIYFSSQTFVILHNELDVRGI